MSNSIEISITFFGQLQDVVNAQNVVFKTYTYVLEDLLRELFQEFPALEGQVFALAINDVLVDKSTHFAANDHIALMPPFAGG